MRRSGIGLVEVIVAVVIVALMGLLIVSSLPRSRESARAASCQRNLLQIGMALATYQHMVGRLPAVPSPPAESPSPLGALLGELGVADFDGLADPKTPPARSSGATPAERPIAGFLCPSDPNAHVGLFPAPVSYRANTGTTPDGRGGPFAPGRSVRLEEVETADGTGYTAAFSERLIGDGRAVEAPWNYALTTTTITSAPCPAAKAADWRGDAGSSWAVAGGRTTLYNHALTPGAAPSCLAADGRTALMGASSAHVHGVHVLMLDGSVRTIGPRIDPKIWSSLGTINNEAPSP